MKTIILTGGGTAGHCTPNLALLPYLKEHFDNIIYFGSENGIEKSLVEKENIPFYAIPCAKLVRHSIKSNVSLPFNLLKGINSAGKLIDKIKPDVIFSKGGYVAVPTVISASKRKIPVISHESDYTIGLANKICAKYSKKVLTSFPETAKSEIFKQISDFKELKKQFPLIGTKENKNLSFVKVKKSWQII